MCLTRKNLHFDLEILNLARPKLALYLAVTEGRAELTDVVKKFDGNMEYCVVMEKKRGDNDTWLYVLKERDSDRQLTVDLDTLDWSPLTEGNGK